MRIENEEEGERGGDGGKCGGGREWSGKEVVEVEEKGPRRDREKDDEK